MKSYRFYITDAFTDKVFGGNPAGVVLLDNNDFPPFDIMQKTAAELGFSETAFIKNIDDRQYELRYITPTDEVDLCGHATIASFYVISRESGVKEDGKIDYRAFTKTGEIGIDVSDGLVMMDMAKPEIIKILDDSSMKTRIRKILGLEGEFYGHIEPAIVSTGLPDILFPVNSKKELSKISADYDAMTELSKELDVVGIHAFALPDSYSISGSKPSPDTESVSQADSSSNSKSIKNPEKKYTAFCRNFAPLYGIPEEAATGTANGALTYYLYKESLLKKDEFNVIIQGEAMGRPSKITTIVVEVKDGIKIRVGGPAAIFVKGEVSL